MRWKSEDVLAILDQCSAKFTFPMLDNGYVYLAATRLSLHRTEADWGMVIEAFGYSPRAGITGYAHLHFREYSSEPRFGTKVQEPSSIRKLSRK